MGGGVRGPILTGKRCPKSESSVYGPGSREDNGRRVGAQEAAPVEDAWPGATTGHGGGITVTGRCPWTRRRRAHGGGRCSETPPRHTGRGLSMPLTPTTSVTLGKGITGHNCDDAEGDSGEMSRPHGCGDQPSAAAIPALTGGTPGVPRGGHGGTVWSPRRKRPFAGPVP